ncbi:hypothetical protein [Promicromonospora kroppenstedtii]|uniref:hypothetical protein n=1 Tax=Promicromonospora kroppenstedtii TaxID=440482 RepID=UPI0004BC56DC|nr:hypothetical protein [Promicromonospora kroppenstedtii]
MTTLVTPAVPGPGQDPYPSLPPGGAPSLQPGLLPGSLPPDVPAAGRPRGWWRRNAVWLVLLPIAVVVTTAASSFRVWAFWWPDGVHYESQRVALGEPAHLASEYLDMGFDVPERANTYVLRELDVTVTGVEQVDELPEPAYGMPVEIPEGSVAYEVRLHFAAELRTDLSLCTIALVSDDGTRYGEASPDVLGNSNRCLPDGADGFVSEQPEWDVSSFVLVDPDATIEQVRLSFGGPDYLAVELP